MFSGSLFQELSNPLVRKHLDLYPELTYGKDVYKFSQSFKWLAGLSRAHRPQMVDVKGKHFYIYEPVQLISKKVVIPIYFFKYNHSLHSMCILIDDTRISCNGNQIKITIPDRLHFSHSDLKMFDINDFKYIWSEILLGNGKLLWKECGSKIYGESYIFLINEDILADFW